MVKKTSRLITPVEGHYPILRAEDLAGAWAYVRSHRHEIDQQIRENEAA